jgi:predicted membrane protein
MKMLGRILGMLMLAWFATMAAALAVAVQRKGEVRPSSEPDADEIDLSAYFEPLEFRSTAAAFRGGQVECWFGGGTIDLREATIDPSGARLRVTAVFGGGTVLVPEDWVVETHVVGIGGAGDARARMGQLPPTDGAPRLVIEGKVVFGGFGVLSRDPREAREPQVEATAV